MKLKYLKSNQKRNFIKEDFEKKETTAMNERQTKKLELVS